MKVRGDGGARVEGLLVHPIDIEHDLAPVG
jgi:hypothetical protein